MGTLNAGLMSHTRLTSPAVTSGGPPADMSAQEPNHEDADFSLEEAEFNWEEYLEETGSTTAPHSFFKHVDTSMQTGLSPGMKLEVPLGTDPQSYWVASIITTCGKLLLLRYDGCGEDRSADFWCDIVTSDLHSIGWAQQNKKTLRPPEILKEKLQNWEELLAEALKGTCSAPSHLLEGPHRGKDPLDLFGPGCRLELQHSHDSLAAWPVHVIDNIGGRLQLQYDGAPEWPSVHCFYLNPSLHELGWASKNGFEIKPPEEILHLNTEEKWKEILAKGLKDTENCIPDDFFQERTQIPNHTFTTGMKMEAINPKDPSRIVPATVNKVFNDKYFLVELDDLRPETSRSYQSMVCHRNSPQILPARWSLKMGLTVQSPPGYTEEAFEWDKYLTHCNAHAAPDSCFPEVHYEHVLQERMKLEAVNPFQPQNICIATVTRVTGLYIWLQLEGVQSPVPECIVHLESTDIFPMGWCETNGHPLCTPPPTNGKPRKKAASNSQKPNLPAKNGHGVNGSDTVNTTTADQEPSPAPEQEEEPSPAPEQEEEPSPAPEQEEEPSPAPEQEEEPSPAPEQEEEPSPAPEQEEEPAPASETEQETTPAPDPNDEARGSGWSISPSPGPSSPHEEQQAGNQVPTLQDLLVSQRRMMEAHMMMAEALRKHGEMLGSFVAAQPQDGSQ